MKKLIVCFLLMLSSTLVQASDLMCSVMQNAQIISSNATQLEIGERKAFSSNDNYVFYLARKSQVKFELEVYDSAMPSRSYAEGNLEVSTHKLAWAFWSRDILLEVSCQLAN